MKNSLNDLGVQSPDSPAGEDEPPRGNIEVRILGGRRFRQRESENNNQVLINTLTRFHDRLTRFHQPLATNIQTINAYVRLVIFDFLKEGVSWNHVVKSFCCIWQAEF